MEKENPIGFVDSGLGGLSVLHQARQDLPREHLIYYGDSLYNPYGVKSKEEIFSRMRLICDMLIEKGCKAIVIACNTATSACINELRALYDIDLIGMEPAIKPAAQSERPLHIALWATELTLREKKLKDLLDKVKQAHTIDKIACMDLVELIEHEDLDQSDLIDAALKRHLEQSQSEAPIDRLVLGCTHFVFFKKRLAEIAPKIELIDGNEGTIRHLKEVLKANNLLNEAGGSLEIYNSDPDQIGRSRWLLNYLDQIDQESHRKQ